jgi:hypothetical protein
MRVSPATEASNVAKPSHRPAAQAPRLGEDELALGAAQTLDRALENAPAARADKVAQAKALVADASYPSEAVLDRVAGLLASGIRPKE